LLCTYKYVPRETSSSASVFNMAAEEEELDEEITKEDKINILRYFISNAPPGHQGSVLKAVKLLNMSDVMDVPTLTEIFKEFNFSTGVVVPRKDGGNYVIDSSAEVTGGSGNTFRSTRCGEIFTVDHVKGTVVSAKKDENGPTTEQKALQNAMEEYAKKVYHSDKYAVEVFSKSDDTLQVVSSVQNVKIEAFWSGRWQSHYLVKFSDGSAKISGDVRVLLHYFEGGNVQQSLEKDFEPADLKYTDATSLAKAAVEKIEEFEQSLQTHVSKLYGAMEDLTKGIRRVLPINKARFDWENYSKYQVRDEWDQVSVTHSGGSKKE